MRTLIVTNLFPNPYQPMRATYNRQHFGALGKFHEVRVVAPISWVDETRARLGGQPRIPNRASIVNGLRVTYPRYFYTPGVLRGQYGRCFLRSIKSQVLRVADEFQPDVLLASWAYPDGYAVVELAQQLGIPAVVQVLGSDINLLAEFPERSSGTRDTLQRADAVVAVSQDLANKVVETLGVDSSRVHVVYGGVNTDVFHPGPQDEARQRLGLDDETPRLLFIGNLVPVKAVDVLVAACGQLADRFPQLTCDIIGSGPLRKRLESQAEQLGLGSRVQFRGTIPHDQLPDWLRAADLLVLPSLHEGVPNVLLEAIACGRPYVASRTGGIPEISDHAGCRLAAPGDADSLAAAISEMLEDGAAPSPQDLPTPSWDAAGKALAEVLERYGGTMEARRVSKGRSVSEGRSA